VEGKVTDANGNCKYEVNGTWHEELRLKEVGSGREETIWKAD